MFFRLLKIVQFLRRIVGLDRLRLDDHTRVTVLVVLALSRYRPRHVTTCESERYRQAG